MRSALSLTLVLLAAVSGQAASACERASAHHPLRVLLAAGQEQADYCEAAELGLSPVVLCSEPAAWAGCGVPTLAAACTEPASRSYECALVAAIPIHGP